MSLRRFANILIIGVLLTVFVPFLFSRITIGVNAYIAASEERESHIGFTNKCLNEADLREYAGSECHRRSRLAKVWPVLIALQTVADQTHTCGTVSCTDLMGLIVQRVGNVLFSVSLAAFLALIAWSLISKLAAPFVRKGMRSDYQEEYGASRMEGVYRRPLPAPGEGNYIEIDTEFDQRRNRFQMVDDRSGSIVSYRKHENVY